MIKKTDKRLLKKTDKRLLKKIVKKCLTPEDFCFEYINGASLVSDIRRMKEYVSCVRKVEAEKRK